MELDTAHTCAVMTVAGSISMFATHAVLFALLLRAFNALLVGMQVETPAFFAISQISVGSVAGNFTELAGLVSCSGVAVTVTG